MAKKKQSDRFLTDTSRTGLGPAGPRPTPMPVQAEGASTEPKVHLLGGEPVHAVRPGGSPVTLDEIKVGMEQAGVTLPSGQRIDLPFQPSVWPEKFTEGRKLDVKRGHRKGMVRLGQPDMQAQTRRARVSLAVSAEKAGIDVPTADPAHPYAGQSGAQDGLMRVKPDSGLEGDFGPGAVVPPGAFLRIRAEEGAAREAARTGEYQTLRGGATGMPIKGGPGAATILTHIRPETKPGEVRAPHPLSPAAGKKVAAPKKGKGWGLIPRQRFAKRDKSLKSNPKATVADAVRQAGQYDSAPPEVQQKLLRQGGPIADYAAFRAQGYEPEHAAALAYRVSPKKGEKLGTESVHIGRARTTLHGDPKRDKDKNIVMPLQWAMPSWYSGLKVDNEQTRQTAMRATYDKVHVSMASAGYSDEEIARVFEHALETPFADTANEQAQRRARAAWAKVKEKLGVQVRPGDMTADKLDEQKAEERREATAGKGGMGEDIPAKAPTKPKEAKPEEAPEGATAGAETTEADAATSITTTTDELGSILQNRQLTSTEATDWLRERYTTLEKTDPAAAEVLLGEGLTLIEGLRLDPTVEEYLRSYSGMLTDPTASDIVIDKALDAIAAEIPDEKLRNIFLAEADGIRAAARVGAEQAAEEASAGQPTLEGLLAGEYDQGPDVPALQAMIESGQDEIRAMSAEQKLALKAKVRQLGLRPQGK